MNYQELQETLKIAENENKKGFYDVAERLLREKLLELDQRKESPETFEFKAFVNIALAQNAWHKGNYGMAQVNAQEAISCVNNQSQPDSVKYLIQAKANNIIGLANLNTSNFSEALEYYSKALEGATRINDRTGISLITGNIGIVYTKLEEYERAYVYYTKALAEHIALGMEYEAANVTCNIGILYRSQKDYPLALEYFTKAHAAHEALERKSEAARMLGNIGLVYFFLKQYSLAYEYYTKALSEFELMDIQVDIAIILGHIGGLYAADDFEDCNLELAIEYLLRAIIIDEKFNLRQDLYENHLTLSGIYKHKEDWENFAFHFEQYHTIEHEVNIHESMRLAQRLAIQHDFALIQREQEILKEKNAELNVLNQELEIKNEQLLLLNVEKNEFLGIASHDLKNPLSSITMIANVLVNEVRTLSFDEIVNMANDIRTSSMRMYELIINILDLNKIELGNVFAEKEVFSVSDYTRAAVEHHITAAHAKNITFDIHTIEAHMESSPMLFRQVLDNLISNAVKFSTSNTCVKVNIELNKSAVRISVQDQGPGMTEEDKPKLFKKFSQLSARPTAGEHSTGLGLSIVKKLVEAMNGKIWCESTYGEGATFIVEFPVYEVIA